jgi:hypothetical protein
MHVIRNTQQAGAAAAAAAAVAAATSISATATEASHSLVELYPRVRRHPTFQEATISCSLAYELLGASAAATCLLLFCLQLLLQQTVTLMCVM